MGTQIFSTKQAAEYCHLHRQTFKHHIYAGHVKPAGKIGKNLYFLQDELDKFRRIWSRKFRQQAINNAIDLILKAIEDTHEC